VIPVRRSPPLHWPSLQASRSDAEARASYWEAAAPPTLLGVVQSVAFSCDPIGPARDSAEVTVLPDPRGADLIVSIDLESGHCQAEVFGFKTRPIQAGGGPPKLQMAFNFRPGRLRRLFGLDASELANSALPLHALIGRPESVYEQLGAAGSLRNLQRQLAQLLLERADCDPPPHFVDRALLSIHRAQGSISIARLATAQFVGLKRLERAFRQHVGCTPKMYAQVVRYDTARRALARGDKPAQLAARLGYSDQPHLIRELRRFGTL